jgi:hypothetical protein
VISPSLNHDEGAEETLVARIRADLKEPLTPPPEPFVPRNERNGAAHIIYGLYPRKVAKPEALRAIEKALTKPGVTKEFLMERTRAYAEAVLGTNPTFIPHPSRWYSEERYNDDPTTWVREEDKPAPRGTSFGGNKLD